MKMNKVFITSAVVSKGYQDQPALRFSEKSDSARSVRFKVGERVYDKRADNNTRYVNHGIKAFGALAERIEKMGLKEGSYVNLTGRLDEDVWDDNGTTKRAPVIILDDIEFCYSGGNGNGKKQDSGTVESSAPPQSEGGGSFGGYESFGGSNSLY
jgi:single-stranded DNA-binding protein